jgi:pimeloyl-ACP methyl ester carboxylesterase
MLPPLPELPGVQHRYETVNGIRIHYAEAGNPESEPVVLLHGWPQHWWMWRHQIGPLAERYRVIAPDLRGLGWSDKPRSTYRKSEWVGDLIALLDKLGLERVRLVGHDWGGAVGLLAGLRHPQRIERLVVIAIPHPWRRKPDLRVLPYLAYQLVAGGPLGQFAMKRGFTRVMLKAGRTQGSYSEEELAAYDRVERQPDAAWATSRIYRSFMLREAPRLARGHFDREHLTVPTLWLIGQNDVLSNRADDGYRGNSDDMRLDLVPGANHFMAEEMPDEVTRRLFEFL